MKIEEVANTFFKWRPSIFLMEFSCFGTPGFWASREVFLLCADSGNSESQCVTPTRKSSEER